MAAEAAPEPDDLPEQLRVRREKLARLRAVGREPYPLNYPRTATLAKVRARYGDLPPDSATGDEEAVTGRVIFLRNTGKLCFATLRDGDGTELQAMLSLDRVGATALEEWKQLVDIGDLVGVRGEVIATRRGELSVRAREWTMTGKALRPLPVAHRPLSDEARVRQRYLDLIMRPEARRIARGRAALVRAVRDTLHRHGFVEVETPVLQALPGGATARPFTTRSNAMDRELYLRIATELFLKRAVVGGVERVFEIGPAFRNEGMDSTHTPELTMIEIYQSYADYDTIAALTREVVREGAVALSGAPVMTLPDGSVHDLSGEWPQVTLYGSLSAAVGEEVTVATPLPELVGYAEKHGLAVDPKWGPGKLAEELFEHLVVPGLVAPTFVRDYPQEIAPLARPHRTTPGLVEKWDLYARGMELGSAHSELTDPVVQREWLVAQARLAESGDDEAMRVDEDFLQALEHGMPPLGGVGIGIDRLVMALTGVGIRETILFPLTRPA